MYEGDYFYSSAPSDISSDITIEIGGQGAESDPDLASGRGSRSGPRSRSPHPQSYQSVTRPGPRQQQPSLGDKITRKLFRKKRKEMPGANLDRWEGIKIHSLKTRSCVAAHFPGNHTVFKTFHTEMLLVWSLELIDLMFMDAWFTWWMRASSALQFSVATSSFCNHAQVWVWKIWQPSVTCLILYHACFISSGHDHHTSDPTTNPECQWPQTSFCAAQVLSTQFFRAVQETQPELPSCHSNGPLAAFYSAMFEVCCSSCIMQVSDTDWDSEYSDCSNARWGLVSTYNQ